LEKKNDGVMDDKSDDDDTREVRWSRRRDESGRGMLSIISKFTTKDCTKTAENEEGFKSHL